MVLSTHTVANAIATTMGLLIIGTTLWALFFVSFLYLGPESDMSFSLVVMFLMSLIAHALMIGLSKFVSKNKLLKKLASRKILWVLITVSILSVCLFWI